MKRLIYSLLFCVLLASCEKEETPVTLPPKPNNVTLGGVDMGDMYDKQVFVNLETGKLHSVDNNSWDLGFDADPGGYRVFMNGGRNVLIASTGSTQFLHNVNTASLKWRWDAACGELDSLVLDGWCERGNKAGRDSVYIVDRGFGAAAPDNYFQFRIVAVTPAFYMLTVAALDGSGAYSIQVPKANDKEHVYFSFGNGGQALDLEPRHNDWHITFLRYRWIYYEYTPPLLYQVSGVFVNQRMVDVALDSTLKFYDIKKASVGSMHYRGDRDAIGFTWKYPDFRPTGVRYITRQYYNYIVREKQPGGDLYKLRFLDFYNTQGVKGSPSYEYQRLDN